MHPATLNSFVEELTKLGGLSLLGTPVSAPQMQKMVDWHSRTPLHQVMGDTAKKIHNEISNKWSAHPMFSKMRMKVAGMDSGFTGRAGVLTGVVGPNAAKPALKSAAGIRGAPALGSGGMLHTQPRPNRIVSNMIPKAPTSLAPKIAPKATSGILGAVKGLFKSASLRDSALSIFRP